MKKLYTTLAALSLLSLAVVGQNAKLPALQKTVNTSKTAIQPLKINESRSPILNPTEQPTNRGGLACAFDEDFESGLPVTWTNFTNNSNENWGFSATDGNPDGHMLIQYDAGPPPGLQNESLITPVIDFTTIPNPTLKFDWNMSYYWGVDPFDNYDLTISISENGLTWTDVWSEADHGVFETFVWNTTNVDLSAYGGLNAAVLRFNYSGQDGAFAQIDNISLCSAQNDLRVTSVLAGDIINDYAYTQIPLSQATEVIAGTIFSNVGGTELTDISVESETFSFVNNGNVSIGTVPGPVSLSPGDVDTVWVATGFVPPILDTLAQIFTVTANETDVTPADNQDLAFLIMTEDTWAHDYETEDYFAQGYESTDAIASQGFEMGASYFCQTSGGTIYAVDFALGSATTAQTVTVNIYENSLLTGLVSSTLYDLLPGDLSVTAVNFISVNLDVPVPMIGGNTYTATIAIEGGDDAFILGNNVDDGDAGQALYSAADDAWYNWVGLSTTMRLRVSSVVGVEESSGVASFEVYPNPASDNINVNFITEEDDAVMVNMIAANGQLIESIATRNIAGQVNQLAIDAKKMVAGVYTIQLIGDKTTSIRRVVVQ